MRSKEIDKFSMQRALSAVIGTALNVLLAFLAHRLGLPLYLDTLGTIAVAVLGGTFPGIATALATNALCSVFNANSIYYAILSVIIAICAARFAQKELLRSPRGAAAFVGVAALISGGLGALIQWALLGGPQLSAVAQAAQAIGDGGFASFLIVNIGLNFVDKAISFLAALGLVLLIPKDKRRRIWNSGWRQRPLSERELRALNEKRKGGRALQARVTLMLMLAAITLTTVCVWISLVFYTRNTREERIRVAAGAAQQVVDAVTAGRIDEFIERGYAAPGYGETKSVLQSIRDNTPHLEYVYVYKILEDGCHVVFDAVPQGEKEDVPGEVLHFDPAFEPYLPTLFAGGEVEPIESNDTYGWLLTLYQPIRTADGRCVAYAGVDVSMVSLSNNAREYLVRTLLVFSSFFVLVIAYGLWVSRIFLVYPVNSMAACAESFTEGGTGQEELEEKVKALRSLDIRTGDEVEKLYRAICKMTQSTAEQMRDVRHFAEISEKMQNGLIVTMADMVENRDSDTGAHIQKTSAYVRIILAGLKERGYYAEKMNARYMSDVAMSAPLHDVGKISIPDAVLNKPGKLTDEEFEIMKTHTTAGKEIMERAISTVKGDNYLKEARNMAAYHHERWDGRGYPERLHGEVIPLSARVMAVADVFDALTSPRVYKPAFPFEKAVDMIREGAGTQFDPKCVEVFIDSLQEVRVIWKQYNTDLD